MKDWIKNYLEEQKKAIEVIPPEAVAGIIEKLHAAWREDRHIFVFGNGACAAYASHFVTDLGKSASDALGKRFRCMSLTDNVAWITAIANDYAYEDVFVRQLENFARAGDLVLAMSVSGSSPNAVKAVEWSKAHGLHTIALVGAKGGRLAELADKVIIAGSSHYGRAEDVFSVICHMLCYAFIENATRANMNK